MLPKIDSEKIAELAVYNPRLAFLLAERAGQLNPFKLQMTVEFSDTALDQLLPGQTDSQIQEDCWIYNQRLNIFQPNARISLFKPLVDEFYTRNSGLYCQLSVVGPGEKYDIHQTPAPIFNAVTDCPIGWTMGYGYTILGRFSNPVRPFDELEVPTIVTIEFDAIALGCQRYASLQIPDCVRALRDVGMLPQIAAKKG